MVKIEVERLADLNTPRTGHATLCVGGEMVVAGGHTTGFVPTATAEYYADDKKVMEIAAEAGFSSERSFFRIFKAATGMTTQEWMQKNASISPISP